MENQPGMNPSPPSTSTISPPPPRSASPTYTDPQSQPQQPTYNHTPSNIQALLTHLDATCTSDEKALTYTSDPSECLSKVNTPHSPSSDHPDHVPQAILYPKTTEHVQEILKTCSRLRIAVVGVAGGTSLGGAIESVEGGVVVSWDGMKDIGKVNEVDMDVTVQPGVNWMDLNKELSRKELFFPVDPAPGAQIGGMIAMSCSGTNAYRYGTMKENVISLTFVLADGTVVKTHNRPRKSSAGYDLTHLMIGSEGTLGLVTSATLRLAQVPSYISVNLFTLPAMYEGAQAASEMLRKTDTYAIEAIELLDANCMRAINASGLSERKFDEEPTLFVKFLNEYPEKAREHTDSAEDLIATYHGYNSLRRERFSDDDDLGLWPARKSLGHALVKMKKKPTDIFLSTDAAVPRSRIAKLIRESEALIANLGSEEWFCASMSHVGDGNVHTAIVCPAEYRERAEEVVDMVQELALKYEGTVTGEHGVGRKGRRALVKEVGEAGVEVMERIKRALDPMGILNPGKVIG